jgi:transposase-like protein
MIKKGDHIPGKRRKYTKEFQTESIEHLIKIINPMTEVSKSLGVDYWLLSKWKKAYLNEGMKAFSGKPDLSYLEIPQRPRFDRIETQIQFSYFIHIESDYSKNTNNKLTKKLFEL